MSAMAGCQNDGTIEDPKGPICRHQCLTMVDSVVRKDVVER